MIRLFAAVVILFSLGCNSHAAGTSFAVAESDTPVLNTPDFRSVFGGRDGMTLRQDECGQLRSLEFVALPGTLFRIEAELKNGDRRIYRVTTADYPYVSKSGYFIDERFVRVQREKPKARTALLPGKKAVIDALKRMNGSRYVWGGNSSRGVPEMLRLYPPKGKHPPGIDLWSLKGVDCSGLLYEATGGYTPRNTSALIDFGIGVDISGKSLKDITPLLEPLDLIVWPGHVLIVIDGGNLIESRLVCKEPDKGVRIRPAVEALSDIMKKRKPADVIRNSGSEFVIRRWFRHPEKPDMNP